MNNVVATNNELLIKLAFAEDLAEIGDVTTKYFVDPEVFISAKLIVKEDLIVAGTEIAKETFKFLNVSDVKILLPDGSTAKAGDTVMEIYGLYKNILTAERTALNFIQRLSGIATLTREYVQKVAGTKARILDTRKTTPGYRELAKAAVLAGGGLNHRIGLYDAVMLKDNHLVGRDLKALQQQIDLVLENHPNLPIIIEVDTIIQLKQILTLSSISRILLDNMNCEQLKEAVRITKGRVPLEASGGVNLNTVRQIAETGVEYISVGALTHSAIARDLSLNIDI